VATSFISNHCGMTLVGTFRKCRVGLTSPFPGEDRKWSASRRPIAGPERVAGGVRLAGCRLPADRRQRTGESQRSAACLCFCGATIATVDEHIRSAHRGVGA